MTRRLPPAVETRAKARFTVRMPEEDIPVPPHAWPTLAEGCDAILATPTERLDAQAIASLPASVKIIATFSVGYDHIDLAAAKRRGILVTHTPNVLTDATAEIAMLLMLAAARRAYEGERLVRTGQWQGWGSMMLVGVGLTGKRLGIYGMGRIGRAVAERARAFGMSIHYHNRKPLDPAVVGDAIYHETLESLIQVSDILSLHAPATPETYKAINNDRIALLPDGAIVINTARGDLIDDEALIAALRAGKVRAAGLDVFAGEPRLHPGYIGLENVFLLPHLGSATIETRNAMGFLALDNLEAFFENRPLPSPVPLPP